MVNKKDPSTLLRKGPKRGGKKSHLNGCCCLYPYYRLDILAKLLLDV